MALTLLQMKSMFQDPMRQGIVDLLWQSSLVMQNLNFIEFNGTAYPYAQRKSLAGVAFRNLNGEFTRTAGVTNPAVENLSILGGAIRTDSIAIATKGDRVRANEIAGQVQAAGKFFDKNFLIGDPTVTPGAFYGLRKRLAGTQLITNSANGALPTIAAVTQLLDAVQGPNTDKRLLMNRTTRRNLSAAVVAAATGSLVMDQGKQLQSFNDAPIIEVFKDEAEAEILQFNETCGASNACSSMYCVKFGGAVDELDVQGIAGLPGKIAVSGPFNYGEYVEDVVQMVAGIGIFGGYSAARLQGITAT